MAIDTALKRFSAMNISNPWRSVLPLPDGTIDADDRQVVSLLYSGVLAGVGVPESSDGGVDVVIIRRRR
jgi:hypothetical protein